MYLFVCAPEYECLRRNSWGKSFPWGWVVWYTYLARAAQALAESPVQSLKSKHFSWWNLNGFLGFLCRRFKQISTSKLNKNTSVSKSSVQGKESNLTFLKLPDTNNTYGLISPFLLQFNLEILIIYIIPLLSLYLLRRGSNPDQNTQLGSALPLNYATRYYILFHGGAVSNIVYCFIHL